MTDQGEPHSETISKDETDDERIDKIARFIVQKHGMGTPSILILETIKPAVFVGSELGKMLLRPWLPVVGESNEKKVDEYISMLSNRDNIENLLVRVEELMKEEDEANKAEKLRRSKEPKVHQSLLKRILHWITGV